MSAALPVQPRERVAAIDIIRGFALLGIFIMNMPGFNTSPFAGVDGSHLFNAWYDRGAEDLRTALFDGKFNSMFSFLFGVGFTIQIARLREREPERATLIYLRRLAVLLVLGLIHGFVFWSGDVLHVYAVLGILLLLVFTRLPDRALWILAGTAIVLPTVINFFWFRGLGEDYFQAMITEMQRWEKSNNAAFGHGTWLQDMRENARVMLLYYTYPDLLRAYINFYLQMVTTMLLGVLAGRHRWIQRAGELQAPLRRTQWWALGIGLVTGAVVIIADELSDPLKVSTLDFVGGICYRLCRVTMMTFFIVVILRLVQLPAWTARFSGVGSTGRMPLSNYLLQTAMGLTIFHGWGLGFWGRSGPLLSLALAVLLFFAIQVPLSRWWLRRHEFGPLEYLWRIATYGFGKSAPQGAATT